MLQFLQIEFKKIIPYRTFWVIFGLFIVLAPAVFYAIGQNEILSSIFNFPDIWNYITYIGSWFNLLLGMCIVILVCNEFTFKTFRQHVIDGQDRADFIISKILLMSVFALVSTIYLFLLGTFFGFTLGADNGLFLQDIKYIFIYYIQALAYMSVALIISIFIRSTALSILAFLFSIAIESLIQFFIPAPFDKYFPMEIIANLTPNPFLNNDIVVQPGIEMQNPLAQDLIPLNTTIIVALVYIFLFWGISYWRLAKKDIK